MAGTKRKKIPKATESKILIDCKRRCCLCFGLEKDLGTKKGQIAHIDKNNRNNDQKNLVFLCLNHHNEYDGKTSQSKNITENEIRDYRKSLCNLMKNNALTDKSSIKVNQPVTSVTFAKISSLVKKELRPKKLYFETLIKNATNKIVNVYIDLNIDDKNKNYSIHRNINGQSHRSDAQAPMISLQKEGYAYIEGEIIQINSAFLITGNATSIQFKVNFEILYKSKDTNLNSLMFYLGTVNSIDVGSIFFITGM
ncbi:hypothetical protein HZA38_02650 [Candidatus Peregrinibacteria bacterium]|nr:hypothetical protein [Candidatus Peregrinibacteria bacterium]